MTPVKWQTETSWDRLPTSEAPNGTRATKFAIGPDPDDPETPVVFRVVFPPGAAVPVHLHDTDYCEVILEGSQQVGRTWHHAGDIRIAQAGTAYGPLLAGPEGCTVLIVFKDGRWPAVPVGTGDGEDVYTDVFRRDLTR